MLFARIFGVTNTEDAKHATAEFWQRGGARIGGTSRFFRMNLTWPFVTLSADIHELRLGGWLDVRLPKSDLRRLSCHDASVGGGLRIEHVVPDAPAYIVFWSFNYDVLAASLRRLDYVVDD